MPEMVVYNWYLAIALTSGFIEAIDRSRLMFGCVFYRHFSREFRFLDTRGPHTTIGFSIGVRSFGTNREALRLFPRRALAAMTAN